MKNQKSQRTPLSKHNFQVHTVRIALLKSSIYSFIKQFLGGPSSLDVEALKHENEDLRRKVDELQARLDEMLKVGVYHITLQNDDKDLSPLLPNSNLLLRPIQSRNSQYNKSCVIKIYIS